MIGTCPVWPPGCRMLCNAGWVILIVHTTSPAAAVPFVAWAAQTTGSWRCTWVVVAVACQSLVDLLCSCSHGGCGSHPDTTHQLQKKRKGVAQWTNSLTPVMLCST
jgi:hypothetical protein